MVLQLDDLQQDESDEGLPHLWREGQGIEGVNDEQLVEHVTSTQELTKAIGGHRGLETDDSDQGAADVEFEEDDFELLEYLVLLLLVDFLEELTIEFLVLGVIVNEADVQDGQGRGKPETLLEVGPLQACEGQRRLDSYHGQDEDLVDRAIHGLVDADYLLVVFVQTPLDYLLAVLLERRESGVFRDIIKFADALFQGEVDLKNDPEQRHEELVFGNGTQFLEVPRFPILILARNFFRWLLLEKTNLNR